MFDECDRFPSTARTDILYGDAISASNPKTKRMDDFKGVLGGGSSYPHPRGSLFDDDVGAEDVSPSPETHTPGGQGRNGHLVASDSVGSPPQRVVSSVLYPGYLAPVCRFVWLCVLIFLAWRDRQTYSCLCFFVSRCCCWASRIPVFVRHQAPCHFQPRFRMRGLHPIRYIWA